MYKMEYSKQLKNIAYWLSPKFQKDSDSAPTVFQKVKSNVICFFDWSNKILRILLFFRMEKY